MTINYPMTRTILSAEGSAEVIAYGSNDYTDKWSDSASVTAAEAWSLWDTFPTVVRFGNFVWCWYGVFNDGTYNETSYVLIDIVTNEDNEWGGNIAYPEISNDQSENVSLPKSS